MKKLGQSWEVGFSLSELLLGLALSSFIFVGAYRLIGKTSQRITTEVKVTNEQREIEKFLDHLGTEMKNVIDFPQGTSTIAGNLGRALPAPPYSCSSNILDLSDIDPWWTWLNFVPSGIVALPGLTVNDLDQSGYFSIVDPSDEAVLPQGGTIGNYSGDAIRLVYIPSSSTPVRVSSDVIRGSTGYPKIPLSANGAPLFAVGDYAVIYDTNSRELIRITGKTVANELTHTTASLWNRPFMRDFGPTSFVQRVELATYAYDPTQKQVMRDGHLRDDGFDETTNTFTEPQIRKPNWSIVAKNVERFNIYYAYATTASATQVKETRIPIVADPANYANTDCPNQLGYPFFRHVRIEMTLESQRQTTTTTPQILTRAVTVENLRRSPFIYTLGDRPAVSLVGTPPSGGSGGPSGTQYLGDGAGGF